MIIEIEKQIDAETKEVWSFNMFDLNAVFVAWHREVKPKGKRKWTIETFWDKAVSLNGQQTDVVSSLRAMNTRSKRMVQVRTNDELFEGELTQIAWDIDQWLFMVDGEWFNQ